MTRPVHIGIPAFDEGDWLPAVLEDLAAQDDPRFHVWVGINQPAEYALDPQHAEVDRRNRQLAAWLQGARFPFPLHVLTALDPGTAPPAKKAGAGWARRFLFEHAVADREDATVFISMDADTRVQPEYVRAVREAFAAHPNAVALAAPYYHPLPTDPGAARNILRYEIYMRYYQLSLWRIGCPYAFLPIGSGMAFTARAWRAIGGMAPRKAGEDFYFMQQMRKCGPVIRYLPCRVEPSPRRSVRNPFGTGPAMSRPDVLKQRYPFYAQAGFDLIAETYALFPALHTQDIDLPVGDFLEERLGGYEPFVRMRRNHRNPEAFVRACHERFDALRILQFLRYDHARRPYAGEGAGLNELLALTGRPRMDYREDDIAGLEMVRDVLFEYESNAQKAFMEQWDVRQHW
ncbi:MAG: glycosyltransferase family 2 protein [Acidobacteriota bacterium]|nr:glycosyltransferase family 2 protein [Acidobacteriota bacterium]